MPEEVDVLICGSGSAGVCAGAWLARYGVKFKILEKRNGPLEIGQADGVQCRTVEIFESFGLKEPLLKESYHLHEMVFWSADGKGGIHRTNKAPDTPKGFSHLPHVLLNQARINGLLLEAIRDAGGPEVAYGYEVAKVEVDSSAASDPDAHAVKVTALKEGQEVEFRAKYVLGCDGAHSTVRKSLSFKMIGDSSDVVWGVMDVYPQTNFPDIRKKILLHSDSGTLLNIPREGDALTRFYIEIERGIPAKSVRLEDLQATARSIFQPYKMEFAETEWWSAYSVGQRRAEHFHKDYRVLLAGDACHTHSPKAGQGMNTSLQDGYNIGWKLGAILTKQIDPSIIKTYVSERHKVAVDLLEFDSKWVKLFTTKSVDRNEPLPPDELFEKYSMGTKFMAGLTIKYEDTAITSVGESSPQLAPKLDLGMRFPSTQVVRFCDVRPMQIAEILRADGRWRLLIFAGDTTSKTTLDRITKLGEFLNSKDGPVRKFTPANKDIDAFIESILIFSGDRWGIEQSDIHEYFWPETGKWKMRDLLKTFVDDESYVHGHGHAYETYGIDPNEGALVIVRPDQHIAAIHSTHNHEAISRFFERFALQA